MSYSCGASQLMPFQLLGTHPRKLHDWPMRVQDIRVIPGLIELGQLEIGAWCRSTCANLTFVRLSLLGFGRGRETFQGLGHKIINPLFQIVQNLLRIRNLLRGTRRPNGLP